jgi:hypothetical protein
MTCTDEISGKGRDRADYGTEPFATQPRWAIRGQQLDRGGGSRAGAVECFAVDRDRATKASAAR